MQVLPENAKNKLLPLLDREYPFKTILWSYLQGRTPGVTYVDNLETPTFCLIVSEFHHTTYVGWTSVFDLSAALKEALVEEEYLYLVWSKDFGLKEPELPFYRAARLEFQKLDEQKFQTARAGVSSRGTRAAIDAGNFEGTPCKEESLAAYEVKEKFFQHSFGIALSEDGACVSDASAVFLADEGGARYGEIQIATANPVQRKGHGQKAAVLLIDEMKSRGIVPVWSCNKDNPASEGLATKLGFVQTLEYDILCIDSPPHLTPFWVSVLDKFGATYEKKDEAIALLRTEYLMSRQLAYGVTMRYINLKRTNPA